MKNKGFTLVELLAVIVILAVIALIATPVVLSMIESSRKGSAESSLLSYVDATEKTIVTQSMNAASSVDYDHTYSVMGTTLSEMKDMPGDKACSKTENGIISYTSKENGSCPSGYSENKGLVVFNIDIKGDQVRSEIVNTIIVRENVVTEAHMKFGKYYVSYFYDKATGNTKYCSNSKGFSMDKEDCGNIQDAVANPEAPTGGGSGSGSGGGSGSSKPDEIIPEASAGETMYTSGKIANDTYLVGQNVKYGNLSWKVISQDDTTVTMILKDNYTTGAFDTGGSTVFMGSSSWELLNDNFLEDNELIKQATKGGGLVSQGSNTGAKYYIRLPEKSELSTNIPNNSNTPFWTQTVESGKLYFGDKTGAEGKVYSVSAVTYYQGSSDPGAAACKVATALNTNLSSSVSPIVTTATTVKSTYTSSQTSAFYGTECNNIHYTSTSNQYCNPTIGLTNISSDRVNNGAYYRTAQGTCSKKTIYTPTDETLGIRPVITVKKTS